MRRDVGVRVVRFVSVAANRDSKIGLWIRGEHQDELIDGDAADFCRAGEVRIIRNGIADLGQREKLLARDVALAVAADSAENVSVDFEIQRRSALWAEKLQYPVLHDAGVWFAVLCASTLHGERYAQTYDGHGNRAAFHDLFMRDMLAHSSPLRKFLGATGTCL